MTNKERKYYTYGVLGIVTLPLLSCLATGLAGNRRLPSEYPSPTPSPIVTEISDQGQGCDYNSVNTLCYWARRITTVDPRLDPKTVAADLDQIVKNFPNEKLYLPITLDGLIPSDATGGVLREGPVARINIPEGGWGYIATGHCTVKIDNREYHYPYQKNNVYLLFIKGQKGGKGDQNSTIFLLDYPIGHVFVNQAAPDEKDNQRIHSYWLAEQLYWAANGASNCGTGCRGSITLVFIDLNTGEQQFKIDPQTFKWELASPESSQQLYQRIRQNQCDELARLRGDRTSRMTRPLFTKKKI